MPDVSVLVFGATTAAVGHLVGYFRAMSAREEAASQVSAREKAAGREAARQAELRRRQLENELADSTEQQRRQRQEAAEAARKMRDKLKNELKIRQLLEKRAEQLAADVERLEKPYAWKQAAPEQLLQEAEAGLRQYGFDPGRFNVAIVGVTGSGKTSLFNALTAAAGVTFKGRVNALGQCTMRHAKVDIPGTKITIWDVPGANTEKFPTASYVADMHLAAMDMQIITINERPQQVHADLMMAAQEKYPGQVMKIVYCKGDDRVRSVMLEEGVSNEATAVQRIKDFCSSELRNKFGYTRLSRRDVFVLSTFVMAGKATQEQLGLTSSLDGPHLLDGIKAACANAIRA